MQAALSKRKLRCVAPLARGVPTPGPRPTHTRAVSMQGVVALLADKGEMLLEYFGIGFADSPEGLRLTRLPLLLDSYTPRVGGLPDFVVQLACDVNWHEEQACFKGVARVLANLYCLLPLLPPDVECDVEDEEARKQADREEEAHRRSPASIHFITQ